MPFNDEPTFNAALARVLRGKNPRWRNGIIRAEALGALQERGKPDILVAAEGSAPVVIETEYLPASSVGSDARARIGKHLKESGQPIANAIALRAPATLREMDQEHLDEAVAECGDYEFALHSSEGRLSGESSRWPESGWLRGGVDALADLIESCAVSESLVSEMLDIFENGVRGAAAVLRRAAEKKDVGDRIASLLHQEDGIQTSRMAMAILVNAFTYHALLTGEHGVRSVDSARLPNGNLVPSRVLAEWRRILRDVNYWPIFHIASEVASRIPPGTAGELLARLAGVAEKLVESGVARSQDLSGSLFQRLIADRKFLATFYTLPVSATLLAELAVQVMDVDWADRDAVAELRVADFACGTGTLLSAAYQAMLRRHRRSGGDDRCLHADMVERALFGADIMPAATHLTASMLSSAHPSTVFHDTRIYTLPYGRDPDVGNGSRVFIGSLDLIDDQHGVKLFPTGIQRTTGREGIREVSGEEMASRFALSHESMDLVIMNPPFTRPTNHERADVPVPSFAGFSTTDDEQKQMSAALSRKKKHLDSPVGHGNAGLASNFIDLAHAKLKPGAVLALVLPLTMVSGRAWSAARRLLRDRYEEIRLVTIARSRALDRSFSADTGMAEVLVVARRRKDAAAGARRSPKSTRTTRPSASVHWTSIHSRPRVEAEARILAGRVGEAVLQEKPTNFRIGDQEAGWTLPAPLEHGGYAALADMEIAAVAIGLEAGRLELPGRLTEPFPMPMASLGSVAESGLLHRDVNGTHPDGSPRGPFDIEAIRPREAPTWPTLWRHDADRQRGFVVSPDRRAEVRPGMQKRAAEVWRTATHLHFNQDFGLDSQRLAACWTDRKTIGGPAWPNVIVKDLSHEKALLLWQNTTLGLLLFWWRGTRQQAGRARLSISRRPSLVVLDIRELDAGQLRVASAIFDNFRAKEFLPANEAFQDDVRKDLDRAVLCDLLGLPGTVLDPLALLRDKWCAEPSVKLSESSDPSA